MQCPAPNDVSPLGRFQQNRVKLTPEAEQIRLIAGLMLAIQTNSSRVGTPHTVYAYIMESA
ncbi:MAG: hypothetical protein JPMHGGIA_00452 [Saprospiraceae bacterium]|jgi:hypothetical protein|nr:hypothetical protein [Saprospiraceae bacterium]